MPDVKIHYDRREVWPHSTLAVNQRQEADGVHTFDTSRTVLVTVDGEYAGSMNFSTEGPPGESFAFCYGQRDQALGVPAEKGEQAGAEMVAGYFR